MVSTLIQIINSVSGGPHSTDTGKDWLVKDRVKGLDQWDILYRKIFFAILSNHLNRETRTTGIC